ncbi:hypothetical protein A4A49_12891 [Nicotiana attenuata]|uniref:Uncharacterized protein n=1 Tax=Nicotiana attenuata TaxID=49451 RepID=A0A1J6IWI0_NICAT|nr:hypothetical protein A4A49_12891 [Nicotiana attenuata]
MIMLYDKSAGFLPQVRRRAEQFCQIKEGFLLKYMEIGTDKQDQDSETQFLEMLSSECQDMVVSGHTDRLLRKVLWLSEELVLVHSHLF